MSESEPLLPPALHALATDEVAALDAYHVPRFGPTRALLHANESPYELPEALRNGLATELASVPLHRYPDPGASQLRIAVGKYYDCDPARLVLANGSDELITMLTHAFGRPRPGRSRASILTPAPTFVFYRLAAAWAGLELVTVPLTASFELDLEATEAAIAENRPNVCFFALPNNPTGTLWPMERVRAWAAQFPDTIFVSDEAYGDYAGETLAAAVDELPNLVVMRTLSKIGLAALRVGALYGQASVVHHLERVRPPYNLGGLAQAAATWILSNATPLLRDQCAQIVNERGLLAAGLAAIPDVTVFPSRANLLMVRIGNPGDGVATKVWKALAADGILVRNFDQPNAPVGPLSGCLRITVGTPPENALLLARLGHHLGAALDG